MNRWVGGVIAVTASAIFAACEPSPGGRAVELPVNAPVAVGSDTLAAERIRSYLADALGFTSRGGSVFCSYAVLGQEADRIYLETVCEELIAVADSLEAGSGSGGPVALVLDALAAPARILQHRIPGDGNRYVRDIREIFPAHVHRLIFAHTADRNRQVDAMHRANREAAPSNPDHARGSAAVRTWAEGRPGAG